MKKIIPHILIISSIYFSFACDQKKDNQSQIDQPRRNLKILLSDPVETLDPIKILYDSDWKVASNIFEGLVSFDENDQVINELVSSIEISKDKLEYLFQLKDEVFFHDSPCFSDGKGRKLNSSDVKYTFERLAGKENNFFNWQIIRNKIVGIDQYYQGLADSISGIQIIDSKRIRIKLVKPFSSFLKILATPNFFIVPREAINYYKKQFEIKPVGTGPFRISEYKKSHKIILVKNENYYKIDANNIKLPYLESIEYRTIEKKENLLEELIKDKTNLIRTNYNDYKKIINDSLFLNKYSVIELSKGLGVRFWGFYFTDNDNSPERRKLRENIISLFYNNYDDRNTFPNKLAQTLVPPFLLNKQIVTNDYKFSGNTLEPNVNLIKSDTVVIMANIVYKDLQILEDIFTKLKIPFRREIKPDNYYGEISKSKPSLFRVSMVPSFPDPIDYYSLFYSKNSSNVNLTNFKNVKYDKIYEDVQTINNSRDRIEAYLKLEQILQNEKAAIYLSHQGSEFYIYSKNIKNLKFRYIVPDFRDTYFE